MCYEAQVLPAEFIARLEAVVPPDRLGGVMASFAIDRPPCLWLNPLRGAVEDTSAALEAELPHARFEALLPSALVAHDVTKSELARSRVVDEGRAYIIGPSSLLPPLVLSPTADDAVLDLCAAPGGKALQLAAACGHLAAVEAVRPRFFKLRGILDRYGALAVPKKVRLFLKDGRSVGRAVPERFDKVLVDAPCSSEARFDVRDPTSWRHWSPRKVAECAHKQRGLLRSAVAALKVGGTLVYCTCSFSREENEAVVQDVIAEHDGTVVAVESRLPAGVPAVPGIDLPEAWRVLPDALWDGFFLVRLEKRGRPRGPPLRRRS